MDPITGTLAAAGIGGVLGYLGQRETNEANVGMSQAQMAFQERMSNTAYQRAMADMRTAGLNPMLAYERGGATTPAGSTATLSNALGAGVSSATQGASMVQGAQQIKQSQALTDQTIAMTEKIRSETMEQNLNTAKLLADIKSVQATGGKTFEEILTSRYGALLKQREYRAEMGHEEAATGGFAADVAKRKAAAKLLQMEIPRGEAEQKFYQGIGEKSPYIQFLFQIIRGLTSAKRLVAP